MKPEILPEERVSRRRLTPLRRLVYALLAPLALVVLRAWWGSCRIVRVEGAGHLDAALSQAPSLLPCYWHQHELFCGRWLQLQIRRGLKVGVLISPSVDGEIPARIATLARRSRDPRLVDAHGCPGVARLLPAAGEGRHLSSHYPRRTHRPRFIFNPAR